MTHDHHWYTGSLGADYPETTICMLCGAEPKAVRLIPGVVENALYRAMTAEFPYHSPSGPLTHRQRLRYRIRVVTEYLRHLGLALVNRCDRDYLDD